MAKWLKGNPASQVYIVGHTDMQGSAESNMALSRARSAAVVEALVKQHAIPATRLGSEGVGPYAPVSNNTSEAGRAKNRRVEMVLR
jgi:OmpA-OmpF porin, OOP family